MIIKWSDFLKTSPLNADYDTNAAALQRLISINETPENSFRHLADNKTLVCISKNALAGDIQATFSHTIKRASFLQTNPDYYALMGFGARATAVKIRHTDLFRHTQRTKSVPDFKALLQCTTTDEILNLRVTNDKISIDFYAILPPCLTAELFEIEDLSPGNILLQFIGTINRMHMQQNTTAPRSEASNDTAADGNTITTDEQTNAAPTGTQPTASPTTTNDTETTDTNTQDNSSDITTDPTTPHPAEASFARILNFLYECIKEPRAVQDVTMQPCTKRSTTEWLDLQHSTFLQSNIAIPATEALPTSSNATLIASIGSLTAAMADRQLRDMDTKTTKPTDYLKKFDSLAPITKNTTLLCIMVPDMEQDEIQEIEQTAAWASLIGQKSSTTIVRTIEHAMHNKGCMVYLQKGMCKKLSSWHHCQLPRPIRTQWTLRLPHGARRDQKGQGGQDS